MMQISMHFFILQPYRLCQTVKKVQSNSWLSNQRGQKNRITKRSILKVFLLSRSKFCWMTKRFDCNCDFALYPIMYIWYIDRAPKKSASGRLFQQTHFRGRLFVCEKSLLRESKKAGVHTLFIHFSIQNGKILHFLRGGVI